MKLKVLSPTQRIARVFIGLAYMGMGVGLAVLCKDGFPVNVLGAAMGLFMCMKNSAGGAGVEAFAPALKGQ